MSTLAVDNITDSGGSELLGRRNAIINGNFGVNQRGVSGTVSLSAGEYGHDRWKAGASGCTYTFSTTEGVTTIDISAGSLIQVIEDVNLVTDTYVLSWEGTAQGKIGAGSYGDSGVTGSVTGGSNLSIEFGTGTVSRVQFERGNKPTPFEHRSYGEELALCQRYYWNKKSTLSGNWAAMGLVIASNSTRAFGAITCPVTMRTEPSITFSGTYSSLIGSSEIGALTAFYPYSVTSTTNGWNGESVEVNVGSGLSGGSVYRIMLKNLSGTAGEFESDAEF